VSRCATRLATGISVRSTGSFTIVTERTTAIEVTANTASKNLIETGLSSGAIRRTGSRVDKSIRFHLSASACLAAKSQCSRSHKPNETRPSQQHESAYPKKGARERMAIVAVYPNSEQCQSADHRNG
jgi:hypothetical protein